jgi:phosphomevalonate kinase
VASVIEARAPGKLVIVGEYAVLHGAPGISVAVDVPALARLQSRTGPDSELLIPDTGERFGFHWNAAGGVSWLDRSPGALGLPLESCLATLRAQGLWPTAAAASACRIELDTAAFHGRSAAGQRIKLGLGSSAAVLVALMGVLLKLAQVASLTRDELTAICCAAHRRLQGGSGSGIDVATAVAGGVISIEPLANDQGPRTKDLAWPRDLHMLAVWSGHSASTPAMLARLQDYREQQAEACSRHMARLSDIASRALSAWQREDVAAVLASLDSYASALQKLDQDADIGICSGGHVAMREIARANGAVYKPSGAGGGDFGIALAGSGEVIETVARDFSARGYHCLEAGICARGLAVEATAQPG